MRSVSTDLETYGGEPFVSSMEAKLLFWLQGADGGNVHGWDVSSIREGAKPRTKEWRYAWARLLELSADEDTLAEDPESGECWQYMGIGCFEGRWVHSFRHRQHPILQRRWYLNVPVTPRFLKSITS